MIQREVWFVMEMAKVARQPRCEIMYETISPHRYITVTVNALKNICNLTT